MRETLDILYSCCGHAITCIKMYILLDIWNNNANIPKLKILLHFTIELIRICQKKKLMREINMRNLLVSSSKCSYNVNVHWSLYYENLFHIMFPQNLNYWKRFMYALNHKYLEVLKLLYSWKLLCMWLILNDFGKIYWDNFNFQSCRGKK